MKGNWKKIAAGGVSIGLAVALLATSLTSHAPVQAVDVFSQTKIITDDLNNKPFDIVELISRRSSFPTVTVVKTEDNKISTLSISGNVSIGNEELAYMVGGQEPFMNYWTDLSMASWLADDPENDQYQTNTINDAKSALINRLEWAGLLNVDDLTGYPLRLEVGEKLYRIRRAGNNAFLEVSHYPGDASNKDIIGYYVPEEKFGCYQWDGERMKFVGGGNAWIEDIAATNFMSGWKPTYMEEEEYWEEDFDDEYDYESEDTYWEESEDNNWDVDYNDTQYPSYQEGYDDTIIEDDNWSSESEGETVDFYYPMDGAVETSGVVEIPSNYAEFSQEVNLLENPEEVEETTQEDTPLDDVEEVESFDQINVTNVGKSDVMYDFYPVDEMDPTWLTQEGLIDVIPVYGNAVGDLRTFRYISLVNNEWFKTQVFGIEDNYDNYNVSVHSVMTKENTIGNGDISHNLDCIDRSIIVSTEGKETFKDSVKLVYIAQRPGNERYFKKVSVDGQPEVEQLEEDLANYDISKNLRNDILNRVASNTMACIVNDAQINSILGETEDEKYPVLQNLVSYLYQTELSSVWKNATEKDVTPSLEQDDQEHRVNINESGVAHFVHKNVYAMDGPFVNSDVSLFNTITRGVDEGFSEVSYRIEQENYQREQDIQTGTNTSLEKISGVTRALAIQYILTYTNSNMIFSKARIRVLELQPCYDFTYAPMEYIHPQVTIAGRGTEARISQFKEDFFGDATSPVEVEIVGMTTSEFCGKIEDINVEYDMIYWGSNIGTFNKCKSNLDNSIHTVFNDFDMVGNVYTHLGDINQIKDKYLHELLGHSKEQSYTSWKSSNKQRISRYYRYSGNDILANQINKLIDFLEAGYLMVVEDDFFLDQKITSSDKYTVDNLSRSKVDIAKGAGLTLLSKGNDDSYANKNYTDKKIYGILDTSSNIYQFISQVVAKKQKDSDNYSNFMTKAHVKYYVEQEKLENENQVAERKINYFSRALNQPKIQINMLSQPIDYAYSTKLDRGVEVVDTANYLTADENGKNYLEYEFFISDATGNSSSANYRARLYVDANMDGKYAASEEMELFKAEILDLDNSKTIKSKELHAGTHYLIKKELPEEYIGAVPWQLKIEDGINSKIRGTKTGLCAVKEKKRDIYICQFVHYNSNGYQYLGENTPFKDGDKSLSKRSDQWNAILENVPDFNVHIISVYAKDYFGTDSNLTEEIVNNMTEEELQEAIAIRDLKYRKAYKTIKGDPEVGKEYSPLEVFDPTLESYDMLLFGFTEAFLEVQGDNRTYCDYINYGRVMKFIESGKSVLFTHDTTAIFNSTGNTDAFNLIVRDSGGLDRFGITVGKSNYDGKPAALTSIYNNNPIRNTDSDGISAASNDALKEALNFKTTFKDYQRDIAYKPGTNQTTMAAETVALTSAGWDARQAGYLDNTAMTNFLYFPYDYKDLGVNMRSYLSNGSYGRVQVKVGKVNSGAITEYPYKLEDEISVAHTHGQYYQLDLESDKDRDGEGDTVVWFTINNSISDLDGYNISPYDVRNNYYIFTKDNITYSGAGHSGLNQENEMKLFVNTMIASYRVGAKAPIVKTVISENSLNDRTSSYVPYDPDVDGDKTHPIYFQIKDTNLINDKEKAVYYNAYLKVDSPNGAEIIGIDKNNKPIYGKEITTDSNYAVTGGKYKDYNGENPLIIIKENKEDKENPIKIPIATRQVVNGRVYRMDVPLSLFEEMEEIEIYITGKAGISKNKNINTEEPEDTEDTEEAEDTEDTFVEFDEFEEENFKESGYIKYTISKMNLFNMD